MAKTALLFGSLLIANGLLGYFLSDRSSITALIPAIFGTIILVCGTVSSCLPNLAKHFMHVSALFGLLGTLAAGGRLLSTITSDTPNQFVQINLAAMTAICGGYVFACFRSFKAAGRARRAAESDSGQSTDG